MSRLAKSYTTKLEIAEEQNISAILDAKLEATSPERVVDYVSFGLDNLDIAINRLTEAKKEYEAMIKAVKSQQELIKIGASKWLEDMGIDSLKGDLVSSMKSKERTPETKVKITNKESVINQGYFKTSVDETKVKQALIDGINVDGAELEVTHRENAVTIYGKKAK